MGFEAALMAVKTPESMMASAMTEPAGEMRKIFLQQGMYLIKSFPLVFYSASP
jgi:hypothetical protein